MSRSIRPEPTTLGRFVPPRPPKTARRSPAPPCPPDRVRLTVAEDREVNAARNAAMVEFEPQSGDPSEGYPLTVSEAWDRIRAVEAAARSRVLARRKGVADVWKASSRIAGPPTRGSGR